MGGETDQQDWFRAPHLGPLRLTQAAPLPTVTSEAENWEASQGFPWGQPPGI